MSIKRGSSGKREFAWLVFLFVVGLTIWSINTGKLESGDIVDIVFYWIVLAGLVGMGAFGFEHLTEFYVKLVEARSKRDQYGYDNSWGNTSYNYDIDPAMSSPMGEQYR